MKRDFEALPLAAEKVLLRYDAVLHDKLRRGRTADAHFLFLAAYGEAGEIPFDDERGDAAMPEGAVGHGEDDIRLRCGAVCNEDLRAVQDIMIALEHGCCFLRGSVRAGAGLGQTERADLSAAQQVGQISSLLLLGAEFIDRGAAERGMGADDDGRGPAYLAELLNKHGVGQHVRAAAAVFLRKIHAHETEPAHFLHGLPGKALLLVDLCCEGLHLVLAEVAVHLAQHFLFPCKFEIHI